MTKTNTINIAKTTAWISAAGGLFIFVLFLIEWGGLLALFGLKYLLFALLVNLCVLVWLAAACYQYKLGWVTLTKAILVQLVNVPVAIIMCWLGLKIINTVNLRIANRTQQTITDITVTGCGTQTLGKLEPGAHKRLFIPVAETCALYVQYTLDGKQKQETVAGYVITGSRINYKIVPQQNALAEKMN